MVMGSLLAFVQSVAEMWWPHPIEVESLNTWRSETPFPATHLHAHILQFTVYGPDFARNNTLQIQNTYLFS